MIYSGFLSKSLFMKGLQCHKSLWLHKYQPELLDEATDGQEALYQSGSEVGRLAQDLFPGGFTIPYEGLSHADQIGLTQREMEKGTKTIYEAAFSHDGVFVKVDILHKGKKGWELYEVKSSTKEKDEYLNDIAIQYYVVKGSGLDISKAALVHINPDYVRNGDIDARKLFTIRDVTDRVAEVQHEIAMKLESMRKMLDGEMPVIDIGTHCSNPYECMFTQHCRSHIPEESVFSLADIGGPDPFKLYSQGIVQIKDIPKDCLGWRQKLQVDGLLHQKNHISRKGVKKFLDSLRYPLCFMDFETTYMDPIPRYDGTWPYQLIPFQFSLDIIEHPGAKRQHHEYLHDQLWDPREHFLVNLLDLVPRDACVVTWNKTFEIRILRELSDLYPLKQLHINELIQGIVDLMVPFRQKDIYQWQFNGSYTLKTVLPVLVPELSYERLDICDGGMAAEAWQRMMRSENQEEINLIRRQLLEYCGLDTLAMVRILEKMREMVF